MGIIMTVNISLLYAKIFSRTKYMRWNYFLLNLGLRGLGILNHQSFKLSGEKYFINFIKSNYHINTVFDVGANIGEYTSHFLDVEKIYSFEPHPESFKVMKEKYMDNTSVQAFQIGFSDSEGTAKIYDYVNNEGSDHASIFKKVITNIHQADFSSTKIKLTTIDKFVKEKRINQVSLLKIDTEGNELAILHGAMKTLKMNIINIIEIEFNAMNLISRVFMRDFIELLPQYNFYRLLPDGFLPIDYYGKGPLIYEIFAYQNIVAFRKDIDVIVNKHNKN